MSRYKRIVFVSALLIIMIFSNSVTATASAYYLEEYGGYLSIEHSTGTTTYTAKYNAWTEANTAVPKADIWYRVYKNDVVVAELRNLEFNTCCTQKTGQTNSSSLTSARWDIWAIHEILDSDNNNLDYATSSFTKYYSSS